VLISAWNGSATCTTPSKRLCLTEGLTCDLKQLWDTKDEKCVTSKPGHSPFAKLGWKSADKLHDKLLNMLANAGSWALWNGLFNTHWLSTLKDSRVHHREAMVLTHNLASQIHEHRAKIHTARSSKDKAAEATKWDNGVKKTDRHLNANGHAPSTCTLDAVQYTSTPDQSLQYWLSRGIEKKEKWIARHKEGALKKGTRRCAKCTQTSSKQLVMMTNSAMPTPPR
jgi:hypothetical protein